MDDFFEVIGGIIMIGLLIFGFYVHDKKRESERPIVESAEVCNIEGCTIYNEEQIEKVSGDTAKVCIYFKDNTFICTGHENVNVKYKEVKK